tara:strand:+ start:138 stop:431 length:294 start_codon:yes stop_codon:yes gene_type:complete
MPETEININTIIDQIENAEQDSEQWSYGRVKGLDFRYNKNNLKYKYNDLNIPRKIKVYRRLKCDFVPKRKYVSLKNISKVYTIDEAKNRIWGENIEK